MLEKQNGGFAIAEPLGAPWMNRWTVQITERSVTDCRHCTNCSVCCLNVLILRLCLRLIL